MVSMKIPPGSFSSGLYSLLRFDRATRLPPRVEAPVERVHVLPPVFHQFERHTSARSFVRSSAVSDDGAVPRDLVRAPIDLVRGRADHDLFMVELAKAVNAWRGFLAEGGGHPADLFLEIRQRVHAVSDRLEEHNRLEEEQVYLWPEALLSVEERAEMSARTRREIDNLPPRFSAI
jgi:hypothetical protein